ncbi:MAG TPA: hypothetical protein O0X27_03195 [Methanocorpusculum sp.]|nr:hypothetical protein [Methanocorpusculum sp.]
MITIVNDNKRVGLIWAAIAVFAGIAILLGALPQTHYPFWGCVGVFLAGSGVSALIIDLVMQKPGFPWVSTISIIIGGILIIANIISPAIGSLGIVLGAVALIIVGIIAGITIARRKN